MGCIHKREECRKCFIEHFERRVKRALKERKLRKDEKVLVVGELAKYFVTKFIKVRAKFTFGKTIRNGFDAVITEQTLDDECMNFLIWFGSKQASNDTPGYIKALKFVSDEDALTYAKIRGIKFKPHKKDKVWEEFLNKFPLEMKNNLIRNIDELWNQN